MKRGFAIALIVFFAGAMAQFAADKPITLSLWSGYPEMEALFKHAAEEYKKTHPNVSVEILSHPLREYEQKLSATIPSDTAADILEGSGYTMAKFVEAGLVPKTPADLVAFINKAGRYSDFTKKSLTYKNAAYGIPFFQGRTALFWNTDMFKAVGLTRAPKTFDEMYAYAKKLAVYDKNGDLTRSGHSLRLSGQGSGIAEKFWFVLYPMGGTILEPGKAAGKYHAGYNNDAGRKALSYYLNAVYVDKWDSPKIKHDAEAFELEQTAMFFRESWVIGDIAQKAPNLHYSTAPVPADARWGRITSLENLYVSKSCKNPKVAWDFIQFLVNDANQQWMLDNVGWLPSRLDVDFSAILARKPQFKAFVEIPSGYAEYGYIPIAAFDELLTKLAERLATAYLNESLAGNQAAVAKVLSDAADETNSILRKAGMYSD
jgi:multiple sugar transport system substrate-binding protein